MKNKLAEESAWLIDKYQTLWNEAKKEFNISYTAFTTKYNLIEQLEKKFKRKYPGRTVPTLVERTLDRDKYLAKAKDFYQRKKEGKITPQKSSRNPLKVFLRSNFIVVAPPNFISGFETEDEVKEFLSQSQILSGVKLFVSKPVSIKFDIKIGD